MSREKADNRVMEAITVIIEKKLGLIVNKGIIWCR